MAALSPPPYEMADSMEMEGLSYKDRLMEGGGAVLHSCVIDRLPFSASFP